jgi:hypothetical protein
MASPHVAGTAALMWSQNPAFSYQGVRDCILNNVDPGITTNKTKTDGRLNANRAIMCVPVTISGTVYEDTDGNGTRNGLEVGSTISWTVYADLDSDNTLSAGDLSVQTTGGTYTLPGLAPGTYQIGLVPQPGWQLSEPVTPGFHTVTVNNGQTIGGKNFGIYQTGSVSGIVYEDLLLDGYQTSDLGLKSVTVFADIDKNGSLTAGDIMTVTSSAAGSLGHYTLAGLPPGTHNIIQDVSTIPAGFLPHPSAVQTVTVASGQALTGVNFANYQPGTITGCKYEDLNGDS